MRAPFLALFLLVSTVSLCLSENLIGIKPTDASGKPLNLDFETGTLADWTATGDAFEQQPIKGDTVSRRRGDMRSNHQGEYWIGTFEVSGDDRQGALTSASFKVTHPWGSFLVAGGKYGTTKVELVLDEAGGQRAIFRASGQETEDLERVVVNLTPYVGKQMVVRVVDNQKGHWGHINFDDFRFHETEPKFPRSKSAAPPPDLVKFAGLTGDEAANEMTLPKGFKATLFAGEPDIQQPIAFCIDDKGRIWAAEGHTYPRRAPEGEGKDRILVFEDKDGDGRFDKRTVFMEKLNLVSGLEVGFGGVWIGAAPFLLFVPVQDGDEPKPAGEPKIMLDGWDFTRDTHETLNTFTWGPDGWLYGCHGVFCPSNVGRPGGPDERQWVDAGVWRFHPTKHTFEVFAEGTSNPWGIDFDERGQCFIEACVVPHIWHMVQGARYERQGGEHYCISLEEIRRNQSYRDKSGKPVYPWAFRPESGRKNAGEIKTIGDHVHWAGSKGPHAGNARSDSAGGGHAHAGLLIYQGDSWPEEYRGNIFMNNIHGQRINMDIPERKGSGFIARHGPDFINFNDKWSQVLNLVSDQNGSVYLIDWYDKNQCHHNDVKGHDRSNGRIFKVTYQDQKTTPVDLQKGSAEQLVEYQKHKNDWYARHARRILQERGPNPKVHEALKKILAGSNELTHRLRALWTLHATDGLAEDSAFRLLDDQEEYVRAWTVQLLCEDKKPSKRFLDKFAHMAAKDVSPVVRLYLASAMQRLPVADRGPCLQALISHAEDAQDHNLPMMYWYAAEPLVAEDQRQAVALLAKSKIPVVREFITRRMTAASAVKTAQK